MKIVVKIFWKENNVAGGSDLSRVQESWFGPSPVRTEFGRRCGKYWKWDTQLKLLGNKLYLRREEKTVLIPNGFDSPTWPMVFTWCYLKNVLKGICYQLRQIRYDQCSSLGWWILSFFVTYFWPNPSLIWEEHKGFMYILR